MKAGKPLAQGYFAVLWSIMGDLDYLANVLKLPRFSSASNPCSLCRCTGTGPLTWTDNRATAPWINCCWNFTDWKNWADRSRCPLFDLPGLSVLAVCLDYMHSKYLGLDQYLFGSVLFLLTHAVMGGPTPQNNLDTAWNFIKAFYKEHKTPCQYQYLNKLSMFVRRSGFPKLRGKAAEIRHLGPALLSLWNSHCNPNLLVHRRISLVLKCNVQMESILTEHRYDFSLPPQAAAAFKHAAFSMAQLQTQLAEHFLDSDVPLFDITPKTHMVMHCALLAGSINPRVVWCFAGEDFMQRGQTLAKSCVRGVRVSDANVKMARHYRIGLHMRFQEHK